MVVPEHYERTTSIPLLAAWTLANSNQSEYLGTCTIPTSFLGGFAKPDPLLSHPQQRFLVERANRPGCPLTASLGLFAEPACIVFWQGVLWFHRAFARTAKTVAVNKLETLGNVIRPYFPRQASAIESLAGRPLDNEDTGEFRSNGRGRSSSKYDSCGATVQP
jgi:hypothetical protein